MNFVLLEPAEFRKFASESPWKSFYQTEEIATLREKNGWTPYYFGVIETGRHSSEDHKLGRTPLSVSKENVPPVSTGKLIAASMVVAHPTFLGKSVFYAPGGPLLDYENTELVDFFFKNLKKYAKSHNGYVIHIEPYYELIERGRHGEIIENGFNHSTALKNLKNAGLIKLSQSDEPVYAFVLDINKSTPDEIFANFKRNTRNHIRKAERAGVKIRELKREELGVFKEITESTSARRGFRDKSLSYYEQMYDLFAKKGEVKFILAEVEVNSKKLEGTSIEGGSEPGKARSSAKTPVATGVLDAPREGSASSSKMVPVSAAMFITYGTEVIYLFSGSKEEYMKEYNAQYLIQWHMIKYAAEHGFKRYNFYGIQGLPDKSSPDYGIYDFKKGFTSEKNGRVTELLGAHELPVNLPFYHLHQLLRKLRHH